MNMNNFFLQTDSYKLSHFNQYPAGTTKVYSYIESRGGQFDETLFFGLQKAIQEINDNFPSMEDVEEANSFAKIHGTPFNYEGAKALVELGYLPIKITAVKEGMVVPTRNVLAVIENTLPLFYWIPSFLEPRLLSAVWYGTTVATYSKECKKIIEKYLYLTADNTDSLPFKLHDFGFRGASSTETAGIGGAAHLVNFMGTDTMVGILHAMKYYDAGICGHSVVAAEHSTITAHGRAGEKDAYEQMIDNNPTGILSVVSDSYDIFNTVSNIFGKELKDKILARDGVFVVRPDSGHPIEMVYDVLVRLDEGFGSYENTKGYRVLNDKVRILQGDGIDIRMMERILENLKINGWAAENVVFGMGGKLLQDHNRDTQKFAMKCSYIEVNGVGREVYKDPITDQGKTSKRGRLALILSDEGLVTVPEHSVDPSLNLLETVYEDGVVKRRQSFQEVRELSNNAE